MSPRQRRNVSDGFIFVLVCCIAAIFVALILKVILTH